MPKESSENFFIELLKFMLIAAAVVLPVRLFLAQPFVVSGASMEPTFENAEYLIVDELSYRLSDPSRGDVVVFRYPRDPSEIFIKRVIGLPNEVVYIDLNGISVKQTDGEIIRLDESYIVNEGNGNSRSYELGDDEYFVMGDNRPRSSDSRTWGPLPKKNIIGRAFLRLLPITEVSLWPGSVSGQTL